MSTSNADAPETFVPDWAVAPGEVLADELRSRGMSQTDLAHRTGLSIKHVNQIIKRNASLSAEVALAFERALGVPARFWLRTEAAWQAHSTAIASRSSLGHLQSWLARFPLSALTKRGALAAGEDTATRVDDLLRFFQVSNPDAFEKVWLQPQVSYKRTQTSRIDPYATATWIRLAEQAAQRLAGGAPAYSARELRAAAQELPALTRLPLPDGFQAARDRLRAAGVMLVFVEPLDKTGLFGISKVLDDGRHMIGLTGRMKTLDSFWFAMGHEVGHILLHPKRATFIDTATSLANDDDEQEADANRYASELYLPVPLRKRLLAEGPAALDGVASAAGVAHAIVAGQYAHLAHAYPEMSKYRPRISPAQLQSLQDIA